MTALAQASRAMISAEALWLDAQDLAAELGEDTSRDAEMKWSTLGRLWLEMEWYIVPPSAVEDASNLVDDAEPEPPPAARAAPPAAPAAMGLLPGMPDICLVHDGRFYGLELKRTGGRLSSEQRAVLDALGRAGAVTATAYGLDNALAILAAWGLLPRVAARANKRRTA